MRVSLANVLVLAGLLGCGPGELNAANEGAASSSGSSATSANEGTTDTTSTETSGTDTASEIDTDTETDTTETDTTETDTAESDTSETDTSETDTSAGPECGDGIVDPGESCDHGNVRGAPCPADCHIPPFVCKQFALQCGDTLDNDRDGLIDLYDPDCTSPCDDDEGSFDTDLVGQNPDCSNYECQWDSNTGGGDDDCRVNLACDPLNPGEDLGCVYNPANEPWCPGPQSDTCLGSCLPLTPNACDCFGCCEVDGVFRYFGYATQCDSDDIGACLPCTPDAECLNPCEADACELCFLQDPSELPDDCDAPACPMGVEPCSDPYACPEGKFCQTGCCVPIGL